MVAPQGGEMVAHSVAGDALMVTAVEGRRQAEVGRACLFPEPGFLRPIRLRSRAHRHPDLDPDLGRIAARLFGHPAQLAEDVERALVRPIGVRHPTVAPFGDALQGSLVVAAEPHPHPARIGPPADAGIPDRVPLALEAYMRLGPQRLHNLHLPLRAGPPVVKIFLAPGELDLFPAAPATY